MDHYIINNNLLFRRYSNKRKPKTELDDITKMNIILIEEDKYYMKDVIDRCMVNTINLLRGKIPSLEQQFLWHQT